MCDGLVSCCTPGLLIYTWRAAVIGWPPVNLSHWPMATAHPAYFQTAQSKMEECPAYGNGCTGSAPFVAVDVGITAYGAKRGKTAKPSRDVSLFFFFFWPGGSVLSLALVLSLSLSRSLSQPRPSSSSSSSLLFFSLLFSSLHHSRLCLFVPVLLLRLVALASCLGGVCCLLVYLPVFRFISFCSSLGGICFTSRSLHSRFITISPQLQGMYVTR